FVKFLRRKEKTPAREGESGREGFAATALRGHIGVVELEALAEQAVLVFQRGPVQVLLADRVHDDGDALDDVLMVRIRGRIEVKIVLEPGATAAADAEAKVGELVLFR